MRHKTQKLRWQPWQNPQGENLVKVLPYEREIFQIDKYIINNNSIIIAKSLTKIMIKCHDKNQALDPPWNFDHLKFRTFL